LEIIFLCALAAVAGFTDAVVGGGGLIQIPALFLFLPAPLGGMVPSVLATNKMSSICGTGLAVIEYSRRVRLDWRVIAPAGCSALIFAFLGARVVTLLSVEIVRPLILALLVIVAVYTFWRKNLGDLHAPHLSRRMAQLLAMVIGVVLGFYDGFFGPGTGSFLIFAFVGLFGFDFLRASASAKVINLATNLAAMAYFASTGHVLWQYALPMALCNMVGAMFGVRLAVLKGNRFVRGFFLVVVTVLILRFGWEVFRS
jgi:uncharacterized membrane protein YfcA